MSSIYVFVILILPLALPVKNLKTYISRRPKRMGWGSRKSESTFEILRG